MADPELVALLRRGVEAWNVSLATRPRGFTADLSGAALAGLDLQAVRLDGADLRMADLRDADLGRASLVGADLSEADLTGAHLFGADLSRAWCVGTILDRATLASARLRRATLTRARLRMADLRGADLEGASLRRADLRGATLTGAVLSNADLDGTDLDGPRIDLTVQPPVGRPGADDAAVIGSEIEVLLTWAERFVADGTNPDDLRDEVDARRRQLGDELRLIGQGRGSSTVLTGVAAALLPLVRPEPGEDGLGAALDEVADGLVALGRAASDEERVGAAEEVGTALDHAAEEIAEVIEAHGWEDLKASAWRTAGAWVEEDFRPQLDAFLTALRERALPAGGAATGAAVGLAGGPPWLAVTIVAAGLLRSLFPWIFRGRRPPEG